MCLAQLVRSCLTEPWIQQTYCNLEVFTLRLLPLFWLLVLSEDVEANPGPVSDPCTLCTKAVRVSDNTILCDRCERWSHVSVWAKRSTTASSLQENHRCGYVLPLLALNFPCSQLSLKNTNSAFDTSISSQVSELNLSPSICREQHPVSLTCLNFNSRSKRHDLHALLEQY